MAGEVRELIRRRWLGPFTDQAPVRVLVRDVLDRVAGFGPLQRYLDDPETEEIWVNEPGPVLVATPGRSERTTTILAPGSTARRPGGPIPVST